MSRAVAQAVSSWLQTAAVGFEPKSSQVGFVVNKVALGQIFSEYCGFSYQFAFHPLLHTHHLSSGAGTIDQLVAEIPSGLRLAPPQETKLAIYISSTLWIVEFRSMEGAELEATSCNRLVCSYVRGCRTHLRWIYPYLLPFRGC
jgi:hypothetical protein